MSYDPRTIAFVGEILFPPMQLRADLAQAAHNSLFRQPEVSYQSFQVAADGIHMTNLPQAPGQVSSASLRPDRLVVREELRGMTVESFATRCINVSTTLFDTLHIGSSIAQQFCVRSLVNPKHYRDGREFLTRRLLVDAEAPSGLGRPMQAFGLRLAFPPTQEHPGAHQVRIETWPQDPRSIWIEVTGTYTGALAPAALPQAGEHLYATYGFLTGPVADFVARHDRP